MLYRKLGSTDIEISVIGLGTWAIGGWMWGGTDEEKSVRAVHASLDHGVNLIDTAPAYGFGLSEEIVGRAIQGRRDKVVLATKCGLIWDREEGTFFLHSDERGATPRPSTTKIYKFLGPASIGRELEQSLKRLNTDCIDLYQTHWQDPTTPIEDTMAALLKLTDQGKIRAIGVSNADLGHLKAYGAIDSDQEKYSMLDRGIETNGTLAWCREKQISVLAYSPLVNGLLTGKIRPDRQFGAGDLRKMNLRFRRENIEKVNAVLTADVQPIAARHQATIGQTVIAWTFSQPGITCVLCGARDADQAIENALAGRLELSPAEIETMEKAVHA
jgi:methylglyoxal reductase